MTPSFNTWERETLDKFALEAYLRMRKQEDQLEQLRGDLKIRIVLQEGLENESLHFAGTGFRRLNRVEFGRFPDGANGEFVLPIGREGGHGHEGRDQQGHEQHWNAVNKKADHRGEE